MESSLHGLKCVILGSTGACGKELVKELMTSEKWKEVVCIVRKPLPEWKPFIVCGKLKVMEVESLEQLQETEKWKFEGFHSFFCLLGARLGLGKENFLKVDYHFPIYGANIALANGIPHYSLLTASEANEKSMFLYQRTKGLLEKEIGNMNFKAVSVFRPGLLTHRDRDKRLIETILFYVPFIPKISAREVALSMKFESEALATRISNFEKKEVKIFSNSQMKEFAAN